MKGKHAWEEILLVERGGGKGAKKGKDERTKRRRGRGTEMKKVKECYRGSDV